MSTFSESINPRLADHVSSGPDRAKQLRRNVLMAGAAVLGLAATAEIVNDAYSNTNPAAATAAKVAKGNDIPKGVHPKIFGLKVESGDAPVHMRTTPYAFSEENYVDTIKVGQQLNPVLARTYTDNNGNVWYGFADSKSPTGSAWIDATAAGSSVDADNQTLNGVNPPAGERLYVNNGTYYIGIGQSSEPAPSATISPIS